MKTMIDKRYCKQCGKELVRKKLKDRCKKRGWFWEGPKRFLGRSFCNNSCSSLHQQKKLGHTHWTHELILKEFNKINTDKKWNSAYMFKKHTALWAAVWKYYGKNGWNKFLTEQGRPLIKSYTNQKYKIHAKYLLKYWREEEIHNGIGKKFVYSMEEGIPGINQDSRYMSKAMKYLIKLKAVRIFKKGVYCGGRGKLPTQYILLKSRI